MLAINIEDVLNVLTTVAPYLIGFGVVLVIAVIAMIACKKQSKAKKYMIRSQAVHHARPQKEPDAARLAWQFCWPSASVQT